MTTASACGKIILLGEHAVVYGRPALAIPLPGLRTVVEVEDLAHGEAGAVRIEAPDVDLCCWLHDLKPEDPLALIVRLAQDEFNAKSHPALGLHVHSEIPVASGLGSGAAVSVAVVRALSAHWGKPLDAGRQSALAFEVEKLHHGTPSGIDNTVIAFEQPVYFVRGQDPQPFPIRVPMTFILGDSGQRSNTAIAVGKVREAWQGDRDRFEQLFDQVAGLVERGRAAIEAGDPRTLGTCMDENQALLREIGVSSRELEMLVRAARGAGALGAKLSGAGMGGNMIALVEAAGTKPVEEALREAGATWTLAAEVGK